MNIALKEANKTQYWIDLLYQIHYLHEKGDISIFKNNKKLTKRLVSIIKTSKQNR